MRVFTLAKGSANREIANCESTVLSRRCPSLPSNSATLLFRAASDSPPRNWPREAAATLTEAPCKKDSGAPCAATPANFAPSFSAPCLACSDLPSTAAVALRALPALRCCRSSARPFTASSRPATSEVRIASALVRAASSSARSCERWSQSFALISQRSVKSLMYSSSSLSMPSAPTKLSLASAISPLRRSLPSSSWSMALEFSSIFLFKLAMLSSYVFFVSAQSASKVRFSSTNSLLRFSKVSMMPPE
mmetsp:Transcript_82008/g.230806  ORF Transcript_82008/g.230806 Transcript_82008/m.230806 type:complete len:249 (-) Transcript_82008:361-1107(-)